MEIPPEVNYSKSSISRKGDLRSPGEISFRLRQELGNFLLLLRPPEAGIVKDPPVAPLAQLPDPEAVAKRLQGTAYAQYIERLAEEIASHRFPILGLTVETGPEIVWRRDYVHGVTSAASYFRVVPYLDFSRTGDHKIIWELNRHQHLVLLAQAFRLTRRKEFVSEIVVQLETWMEQNPFQKGINWTSALEVAFRALSWIWVYHLVGDRMADEFRCRFLNGLYRHGCHIENNLSIYFSPNTHLLGEAVALHALGVLFPVFPRAARWEKLGGRITREEIRRQVREDGSHFEQSSYYHVYALDMFLFHEILSGGALPEFRRILDRMASYMAALMGPSRRLPFLGDDDGGRFFHPYGLRENFGRATLATCFVRLGGTGCNWRTEDLFEQAVWWLKEVPEKPPTKHSIHRFKRFPDAGTIVLTADDLHVVFDAGPFGYGGGGHSHSDTLSLVVRLGGEDILIDPGTYTYVADPALRDYFRGSAAHNTVRISGQDQAVPIGPFRWMDKPIVQVHECLSNERYSLVDASCSYGEFRHRRVLLLLRKVLFVLDEVTGPEGEHVIEQFWHPGSVTPWAPGRFRLGTGAILALSQDFKTEIGYGEPYGWRSPALGWKTSAPVIRVETRTVLPAHFAVALDCSGSEDILSFQVSRIEKGIQLCYGPLTLRFPPAACPGVPWPALDRVEY